MSYNKIKQILHKKDTTLDVISDKYQEWVADNQLLIFQKKEFHSQNRYIASLCSKRGNTKYAFNTEQRFREFSLPFEYQKKIDKNLNKTEESTQMLFISLTYDTKLGDFKQSWQTVSYYWNLFMANIRKQFGRVLSVRCYEATQQGYAHIHAILWFQDQNFHTFLKLSHKKTEINTFGE